MNESAQEFRFLPRATNTGKVAIASIQQLKAEASALSDEDRRELIGYLLTLGRQRAADYWDRLTAKIEENDPQY